MTKLTDRFQCDRTSCPVEVIPSDSMTALKIKEDAVTCAGTDRFGKQWEKDFCTLQCYVEELVARFQQPVYIRYDPVSGGIKTALEQEPWWPAIEDYQNQRR